MDPIADMIIRIKNAGMAGLSSTNVPYSRMKHDIAVVLEREGYITSVTKRAKKHASTSKSVSSMPAKSRASVMCRVYPNRRVVYTWV